MRKDFGDKALPFPHSLHLEVRRLDELLEPRAARAHVLRIGHAAHAVVALGMVRAVSMMSPSCAARVVHAERPN